MIEKLRQLKERSHMTNQQIAEKSSVPESTVARIFSGKTPNPTITTVISMARAMGGSAADLLSEEDGAAEECLESGRSDGAVGNAEACSASVIGGNGSLVQNFQSLEDVDVRVKIYEDMISLYKEEIRKKDVWLARLFWCLAGIMLFILFVLVFDILHPTFGFVKY